MTKDEIRAEIERLNAEYERIEQSERAKYDSAARAFNEHAHKAEMGHGMVAGLMGAWPYMPETQSLCAERDALKAELAALKSKPTYKPGVWYDWHGGECPVENPNTDIRVRFRDGDEEICKANYYNTCWHNEGMSYDIVAFKIIS